MKNKRENKSVTQLILIAIIALLSGVMVAWWITGVKGQHVDYLGYTDFEVKVVNLIEFLWFVVIPVFLVVAAALKNEIMMLAGIAALTVVSMSSDILGAVQFKEFSISSLLVVIVNVIFIGMALMAYLKRNELFVWTTLMVCLRVVSMCLTEELSIIIRGTYKGGVLGTASMIATELLVVIPVLLFKREKSKNMVQGVEMQA